MLSAISLFYHVNLADVFSHDRLWMPFGKSRRNSNGICSHKIINGNSHSNHHIVIKSVIRYRWILLLVRAPRCPYMEICLKVWEHYTFNIFFNILGCAGTRRTLITFWQRPFVISSQMLKEDSYLDFIRFIWHSFSQMRKKGKGRYCK